MAVAYFPGCSAEGTGMEYDLSTRAVCKALGIELRELEDWNCCGASSAHALDERLALALPARNLALAEKTGLDLMVPCAACFFRLRSAARHLTSGDATPPAGVPSFGGRIAVRHLLDVLAGEPHLSTLRSSRTRDLAGLPVVPYYGCLIVRPPEVTGAVDPESPVTMDRILRGLGAEVRSWPFKTRCCGAALTLPRADIVQKLCEEILAMARRAGAEAIVAACPMCFMNLDRQRRKPGESPLPVVYITELIGLALGLRDARRWLRRHLVDPRPVLAARGIQ